jgi:hypothetical protein
MQITLRLNGCLLSGTPLFQRHTLCPMMNDGRHSNSSPKRPARTSVRMSEAHQYQDGGSLLIAARGDALCMALESHYPGLRFNRVQMHFLSASVLRDDPDRDDVDTLFSLSGTATDLVRHGFAHADWWPMLDVSRTSRSCHTDGFGRVWLITRTRTGYRLQGAQYSDAMTKLALASPHSWLLNRMGSGPARV